MGMGGKMLSKEKLLKMSDKEIVILLKYITEVFNRAHTIISDIVAIQNERYHAEHFRN
jgi:hypothetical protein